MSVHVPPRPRPAPATTNYVHLPRWLFLGTFVQLRRRRSSSAEIQFTRCRVAQHRDANSVWCAGAMGVSPRSGLDHRHMRMDATQGERAEEEAYGSLA